MIITQLSSRGLLCIGGSERISFLQGLITQDARLLEAAMPVYAALLTPQGKYLHDFFLYPQGDAIWLDGEKERIADLKKRLMLYKLRSDVTIELLPEEYGVVALWGDDSSEKHEVCFKDPRLPQLGWRLVGNVNESLQWCKGQGFESASAEDYDAMRLALGVPDGCRDMIPEKSLMLECGMDKLGAVSFEKGCYVGQEVTARSKFRGQVRKMLYRVKAEKGELPEAGSEIMLEDKSAGLMRSHQGEAGLAFLRTEMVEKTAAEGLFFSTENGQLSAHEPSWANMPESGKEGQG